MKAKPPLLWASLVLGLIHSAWAQPIITNQPQNQTNLAGTTATFTVSATGAEPLSYQWRSYISTGTTFTNIPFGTEARLMLTNVQPTTRRLGVVVTDAGGLAATSSPPASLTVLSPPIIAVQPAVQLLTAGAMANFTVTVTGTAPLTYQWRFNDVNLADKTNRTLSVVNAQSANAGNYSVVVANAFGSITSRVAGLMFTTVHRIAGITANPDRSISLDLAGVVPRGFGAFYDLYPLEVSTNLVDWMPLVVLQRTNDSTAALSFRDPGAANFAQRFYRTTTNHLITPFPKPSGPYAVGTFSRLLTDPSRIRNTRPTNGSFMVTFWYPAEARAGVLPDAYVDKQITLVPDENGNPSYWHDPGIVAKFVSHALPGLRLATNEITYPVLLCSHGGGGHRRYNTDKAQELASHGYVVVAMDHEGAFASMLPNGQLVLQKEYTYSGCSREAVDYEWPVERASRLRDLQFIVDELSRFNTNDALLAGRLDLERLGAFGHSWGAFTVAEFARIDARCKAVVITDVGVLLTQSTQLTQFGLPKPFLSMNAMAGWIDCPLLGPWLASSQALFTKATSNAFWCQIQDSRHPSFVDRGSLINDETLAGDPTPASRAQSLAIGACMVSFFDKYLKNQDDHLLDNPAAVYPNIINFQRK